MNKKIFLLIPLGLAIVGCKTNDNLNIQEWPFPEECVAAGPQPPCNNNPQLPNAELKLTAMKVTPPVVCATQGTTFKLGIKTNPSAPALAKNTVCVVPKPDSGNTWPAGCNSDDPELIEIDVPDITPDDYDYGIVTAWGTCLDPRITIIRR